MRRSLFSFVFFFSITSAYCQHLFKQNLGGIATIIFPDTPKSKTVHDDITEYYSKYNNSLYVAVYTPLNSSLRDLIHGNNLDSTYRTFISSAIKSSKGHKIFQNNIKVNDLNGVEFGFTSPVQGKVYYSYSRIVYLNEVLIGYSYWSADSLKKDDKNITDYFNTFKLTVNKDDVIQSNRQQVDVMLGHITAIIVMIAVPILIGLGIVFLIKKLVYKKNA